MMSPNNRVSTMASSKEIEEIRSALLNCQFNLTPGQDSQIEIQFNNPSVLNLQNIEIRFAARANPLGGNVVDFACYRENSSTPLKILEDLRLLLDNVRQPVVDSSRCTFSFRGLKTGVTYTFTITPGENKDDGRGDVPRPVSPIARPPTLTEGEAKLPPSGVVPSDDLSIVSRT